ncbi:MAG: sigma-70 family RNA polymerase sigma factor [bacterium]
MHAGKKLEKDRRLVDLCAAGDDAAWDRFLERYGALIYRTIWNYKQTRQEVRELFIYVIEGLWSDGARRLRAWEGRSGFATYLAAVTSRLCVDYLRGRMHKEGARYESLDAYAIRAASRKGRRDYSEEGAPGHAARHECDEVLMDCIRCLAREERDVVTLFYWQGRRYAEIAAIVGITENKVGKSLLRARANIQLALVRKGIKNIADLLE